MKKVLGYGNRVRHSVIPLYDTAIFDVGIIVNVYALKIIIPVVEHLLQTCQSKEHRVCILAQNHELSQSFVGRKRQNVAVELFVAEYVAFQRKLFCSLVSHTLRTVHAEVYGGTALYCLLCKNGFYAMLSQHFGCSRHCRHVDSLFRNNRNSRRETACAFGFYLFLRNGMNVIDLLRGNSDARDQKAY